MTSILDKMNLRPQERRVVVIVSIVVFAVLNFVFVFPHFGDLEITKNRRNAAEKKLNDFRRELNRRPEYEKELKRLESAGQFIPSEAQALELQREVDQQARQSGVMVNRWDTTQRASSTKTNSFFDEQTVTIQMNSNETNLVDFLYNLGKGQSLTRVRSMTLRRDMTQTRLDGSITLVKSFQKKPPTRATSPTTVASATTTKASPKAEQPKPATTKPPVVNKPAPATNAANAGLTNLPRRSLTLPAAAKK
jgi:hypothetical protein